MREPIDTIDLRGRRHIFSTLAEVCEDRNMVTDNALSVDLGEGVRFVADRNRRATYIFKGRILDPQLLTIARVDRHSGWNLAKVIADERQTGLMLFDGSLALSLKGRVQQSKLPARR